MSKINDGGPVYVTPGFESRGTGLSIRDYFAAQIVAALSVQHADMVTPDLWDWDEQARMAYKAADAMLAAREGGGE